METTPRPKRPAHLALAFAISVPIAVVASWLFGVHLIVPFGLWVTALILSIRARTQRAEPRRVANAALIIVISTAVLTVLGAGSLILIAVFQWVLLGAMSH